MNSPKLWSVAFLILSVSGCAAVDDEGDVDQPNQAVDQALTSFSFDSTAIAVRPTALIPRVPLTLDRVTDTNVAKSLLLTTETPTRIVLNSTVSTRPYLRTSTWEFDSDASTGRVLAVSLRKPGLPVRVLESTLQADSLSRLKNYGIGSEEVGRVLQRRVLAQDMDSTAVSPGAARVHSYKTFVYRAINGIPVEGQRAVISHGLDGQVRRMMVSWAPLARSGHLLRSNLTTAQIEAAAVKALAAQGETTGKVSLAWRYIPTRTTTGEVTLKLSAVAHVAGAVDTDGTTEEPRYVPVDVSAVP